jgi:hypothetical protein
VLVPTSPCTLAVVQAACAVGLPVLSVKTSISLLYLYLANSSARLL